jgi:hypothetical protein
VGTKAGEETDAASALFTLLLCGSTIRDFDFPYHASHAQKVQLITQSRDLSTECVPIPEDVLSDC